MPDLRHRWLVLAVVAVAAAVLALGAGVTTAEPAAISAKRAELHRIQAQVDAINAQVESAAEAYNGAQYELGLVQDRITDNTAAIAENKRDIGRQQRILAERLRQIYATPEPSLLEVLVTTGSLTAVADELDLLDQVGKQDAQVVGGLRQHKATLARLRAQLLADRRTAAAQVEAKAQEEARVESLLAQRKQVFQHASADLRRMLKEEKERRAREAAAAAALARARRATSFSTGGVPLATPVPSGNANATAAGLALNYLGVPYVWGGASPSGFDCSGLASYVYAQVGKSVPHYTRAIWAAFPQVGTSDLQPGDLVFFFNLDHVGIYLGGDQFVQAPHTGDVVKVSQLSTYPGYVGAVRP